MKKNKGFTLIELLAVIVILAILITTAIPAVSRYLDSSRKDTYVINVKQALNAVITDVNVKGVSGEKVYTLSQINDLLDKKLNKSSYGNEYDTTSYIKVIMINNTPTYEICIRDNKGNGIYKQTTIDKSKITVNNNTCGREYYTDNTGAPKPELYQGMIPVIIASNGTVTVADVYEEWYDYASHEWANAVLVDTSNATIKAKYFNNNLTLKDDIEGTTISESEILQYYVWIPRYKYKLWNVNNGNSDPFAIEIVFEDKDVVKSTGAANNTYLTHPAFTFGSTELNGIWVGKFESSGEKDTTTGEVESITIKPNMTSLTNITVGSMFRGTRAIETTAKYGLLASEVDTHMMKNMEWGATAYLTSSIYGIYKSDGTCNIPHETGQCEVWINNVNTGYGAGSVVANKPQWGPTITGCVGASVSNNYKDNLAACQTTAQAYNGSTGINASTTGNITGIYDMSGGSLEYVMGNMVDSNGDYYELDADLSNVDAKYYDSYAYDNTTDGRLNHSRGLLGDATKETLSNYGVSSGGWNGDYDNFPNDTYSWFQRGGYVTYQIGAGIFDFSRYSGGEDSASSFRTVITKN